MVDDKKKKYLRAGFAKDERCLPLTDGPRASAYTIGARAVTALSEMIFGRRDIGWHPRSSYSYSRNLYPSVDCPGYEGYRGLCLRRGTPKKGFQQS